MWDRFSVHLWSLGHDRRNLWFEGLWERLLNPLNGWPMAFERVPFVALEANIEQTSWRLCKNIVCWLLLSPRRSPRHPHLCTLDMFLERFS